MAPAAIWITPTAWPDSCLATRKRPRTRSRTRWSSPGRASTVCATPSRFEAWFDRILVNGCRDRLRRRGTVRFIAIDPSIDPAGSDPFRDLIERDALLAGMSALTPDERIVIMLRFWADLPLDEIADRLGWPLGTVKSRLHRASTECATVSRPKRGRHEREHRAGSRTARAPTASGLASRARPPPRIARGHRPNTCRSARRSTPSWQRAASRHCGRSCYRRSRHPHRGRWLGPKPGGRPEPTPGVVVARAFVRLIAADTVRDAAGIAINGPTDHA